MINFFFSQPATLKAFAAMLVCYGIAVEYFQGPYHIKTVISICVLCVPKSHLGSHVKVVFLSLALNLKFSYP